MYEMDFDRIPNLGSQAVIGGNRDVAAGNKMPVSSADFPPMVGRRQYGPVHMTMATPQNIGTFQFHPGPVAADDCFVRHVKELQQHGTRHQ